MKTRHQRKPEWLKKKIPAGPNFQRVNRLLSLHDLHTVCQEARCPNRSQCFHRGTATFLLLGDVCTRACRFCAVKGGNPVPPDPGEPERIVKAVRKLKLSYVVLTSVTRDDLPDGGANHFNRTVGALLEHVPGIRTEVLIPDFAGSADALQHVINAGPSVVNHNIETVPRLYAEIRPEADYSRSLELLQRAHAFSNSVVTKSGIMLGLGEIRTEVVHVMEDLREAGCSVLTLGQYLQPLPEKTPVARYLPPEEFAGLRELGLSMGFAEVVAGPFVRSSYEAEEAFRTASAHELLTLGTDAFIRTEHH